MTAFVVLCLLVLVRLFTARHFRDARSVILRVSHDDAWEAIRDFPALHAAHTRGRPLLAIQDSALRTGDGCSPGSVWRQRGRWGGGSYWVELELVDWDPPRRLSVRMVRDSLATHRGLVQHRADLILEPVGPGKTKLTWCLSAHFGALHLLLARLLSAERLRTRLLDVGLRSLKVAIEGAATAERPAAGRGATVPAPSARGVTGFDAEIQPPSPAGRSMGRRQDDA